MGSRRGGLARERRRRQRPRRRWREEGIRRAKVASEQSVPSVSTQCVLPLPLGLLLFHFCFYLTYVSIFLPGLVIFEGRKKEEGKEKGERRKENAGAAITKLYMALWRRSMGGPRRGEGQEEDRSTCHAPMHKQSARYPSLTFSPPPPAAKSGRPAGRYDPSSFQPW